ncbi:hypothetical protein [Vibrio sp. TRT 17S01]|uniref:hypothetical protein n=1 Tax=Vibrio sp. TRT 17S01 TaxID=3418505 RepID=UPI003CE8208E
MSVIIGTTNLDGTGSSADLTPENGFIVPDFFNQDGIIAATINSQYDVPFTSFVLQSAEWNKAGYKEAKVDGSYESITIDNFVDVDITNQSSTGTSHIDVLNVKRGQIDTTGVESDDSIYVGVRSNSDAWGNTFEIETGAGDDNVTLAGFMGSEYTEFKIELGEGNDVVDISTIEAASHTDKERVIEGGEGLDTLVTNGDAVVRFEGFEVVEGTGFESGLTLDAETLENNVGNDLGLVVANIDVSFGEGISEYEIEMLDQEHIDYLNQLGYEATDFSLVNVYTDADESFTLLVEDDDYALV